jgi:hypothetical protein
MAIFFAGAKPATNGDRPFPVCLSKDIPKVP